MRNRLDRDPDAAIRETDSDAAIARLSAVNKHYLHDPFINLFISQSQFIPPRPPLINWGTYIRSKIIDDLIVDWARIVNTLSSGSSFQIVSLGAGSDTRFWRLVVGSDPDFLYTLVLKLPLEWTLTLKWEFGFQLFSVPRN